MPRLSGNPSAGDPSVWPIDYGPTALAVLPQAEAPLATGIIAECRGTLQLFGRPVFARNTLDGNYFGENRFKPDFFSVQRQSFGAYISRGRAEGHLRLEGSAAIGILIGIGATGPKPFQTGRLTPSGAAEGSPRNQPIPNP
jgi:hypothetical protein